MNTNNTRKLKRISVSRSPSPVSRPIKAQPNNQSAYTGLATPKVAEAMNMSFVATQIDIKQNTQKSRPSSATFHMPLAPHHVSYNRPKSATLVPLSISTEQAHHGQLKTVRPNLQRQQGSRLLRTRRRKARKSRKSRRN